jgi:DnaK suppressor protein
MNETSTIDLSEIRRRLLEERGRLLASSEQSEEERKPVTLDQQNIGRLSRMDALQGQAMALATEERRRTRRQQIDAALDRLERDEYGECALCGEPIAPRRLALDPAVATCLECASAND